MRGLVATMTQADLWAAALKSALRGRTQNWLATLMHVEQQTVSRWLKGNPPPPAEVFRIEQALFGEATGDLSRHLGYVPADRAAKEPPCTVARALVVDDTIDERLRLALRTLVEAWPKHG